MKKTLLSPIVLYPVFNYISAGQKKIGGQAIIEGVMMRGIDNVSWAVRKNDREVVVERREFISAGKKYPFLSWPVLRGAVNLIESLVLGYQALSRSAEIVEEGQRGAENKNERASEKKERVGGKLVSAASVAFSLIAVFGIFMYLPMRILSNFVPKDSALLFNMLTGVVRIVFFLIYLILISFWKEIRRVFEYHGAEHMAIFAYEADEELTIENMRRHTTFHPRCGTSFLLLVGIVSVFLFSVVDAIFIKIIGPYTIVLARFAVHLLLVPLISGVSYEALKLSDSYRHIPFIGLLILPGLWLQRITTQRPDDYQLEVAVKALKAAL